MPQHRPLQTAEFVDLLDVIYECVMEPELWSATLGRLASASNLDHIAIVKNISNTRSAKVIYEAGAGLQVSRLAFPLPRSTGLTHLPTTAENEDIFTAMLDDETTLVAMAGPNLRPAAEQRLTHFLPHLQRCLALSSQVAVRRSLGEQMETLFENVETAILLVDPRMRLEQLNRAARALLAKADLLRTEGELLVAANPDHDAALAGLVSSAIRHHQPTAVAFKRPDGLPAVLHAKPLAEQGPRTIVSIIVVQARTPHALSLAAFARLAGLTDREAAVFQQLAAGETVDDIAAAMGIGKATVRSHVLRIYQKTGSSRQAEIVALAHAMSPP